MDFPKEKEGGNLEHYRQCLWSAVRLAHQVAVCWALSKYASNSRFLSMAIVSGDYATLDKHLLPILNAKLPDDPVIRLSDYARHGLLINDIRVILCQKPAETGLYSGESLPIWWITSLWTTHYFDFVSDLLHDETLQNTPASIEKLNQLLWPMEDADSSSSKMTEENAITTFFKYPHNSMLGVEIAKTLYYRKRYSEAAEILRIVLSINPRMVARTLRMMVLRSMAIDTPSHRRRPPCIARPDRKPTTSWNIATAGRKISIVNMPCIHDRSPVHRPVHTSASGSRRRRKRISKNQACRL